MLDTKKIREVMKANRWNTKTLAEAGGLSRQAVWQVVNGKSIPKVDTLQKICSVLGLEIADVLRPDVAPA